MWILVVLVSLLFAAAASGLSIPSADHMNSSLLMVDSIQDGNMNVSKQSEDSPRVRCRPNSNAVEFLPSLSSCGSYHICAAGVPTPQECSEELVFNINRMVCSTTGRCLLDYQPLCRESGIRMPHVHECRHFFFCEPNEVEPILMACIPGEFFDQRTLRCVRENLAVCGNPPNESLEDWPGTF